MTRHLLLVLAALLLTLGCDKKEAPPTPEISPPAEATPPQSPPPGAATKGGNQVNNTAVPMRDKQDYTSLTEKGSRPLRVTHLTESAAKVLAKEKLGGYKLKDFKIKKKSPTWHEIKMTYKKDGKEVKVVVNDVPPKGDPAWKTLIMPANQTTKGYPSMLDVRSDKQTLMLLVGKGFRVDFKTRNAKAKDLEKMASEFGFKTLESLD